MKTAKFIKGLIIEETRICEGDKGDFIRTVNPKSIGQTSDGQFFDKDSICAVEEHFVPVHQINHIDGQGHYSETYIAYSKEVQRLLQMPFDVIVESSDSLKALHRTQERAIQAYHNQPWYKRVCQAFQGRIL